MSQYPQYYPYAPQQQYAQQQYAQPQYAQQQYAPQYAPHYAQAQYQAPAVDASTSNLCTSPDGLKSWFNVTDKHYLGGLAVGAAVALVLTNPTVQQALVKGAVKLWTSVQGSIEEIKEKVEDVKAEMSQRNG
ncbi:YtxH domain-containing protein [Megalodesulfovibrio gigas]|uniref:YtxH domain-containing protein n=1 Tax=Megalodesulfovibrio gigas (strain ATCC 19364 / DSM 1382 / NCIMB 9332 / VKM B-1759) TaxID=1121448 RepID=T2G8M5_MEGG1|nr:YtxH domain-containing protein [Megalodesulfovibrio gigas]AGW12529.1 hypothetical protein DGI_0622 [Megalodesulfovibrio gigas DSM 1382 = ATCC 19364]